MNKKTLAILIFSASLLACTKKSTQEVDNETQSAIDFSNHAREFVNLISAVHQALIATPGAGANQSNTPGLACQAFKLQSGDTAWSSSTHVNPTFTLNTDAMLLCRNEFMKPTEKNDLGSITVRMSDKLQNPGSTCVIKVDKRWVLSYGDFYSTRDYNGCDSIILKTISSDANTAKFDVTITNGKLISDVSGIVSTMTAKFTLTSTVKGISSPQCAFFGSANGKNSAGLSYSASIDAAYAIIKSNDCYHLKAGIAEIIPFGYKSREIDYGTGNCDDMAKMKVNGNSIAFKLK